uniref:Nuclear receptor coactivator 6 TRADD-N domain-containing protein n=1 Tax=Plectus sambesii TaxID=2011161 RepID=A0A914VF07_9BILA
MNGLSEAVLVCKGELSDPTFSLYLARVKENLQKLLNTDRETFLVSKLEKWNSVRVTFHLPGSAARRLHRLAKHQPQLLFRLGVHSVQVEGNDTVSITLREPQNVAGSSSDHDPLSASSRVESGLGSSRASSDANGHPLSASGVSYGASSSNTPHSCDVLPVSSDPSQGATQHDIIANCSTSAMHQAPAATLQHQGGSPTATSRASSSGASSTNAPYPLANMEQMAAAAVAPNAPPHPPPLQTSLASSTSALGNNSSPLLVNLL